MAGKKFDYKNFSFNISNENMAVINLGQRRAYDKRADELVNAARRVRKQPLFGNIDLDELEEDVEQLHRRLCYDSKPREHRYQE